MLLPRHRERPVLLLRGGSRCHTYILSLAERESAALGALAQAPEDGQGGATKDDDGEEDDDESRGAQHFHNLFGGELAPLVDQVERQSIGNCTSQTCTPVFM